MPDDDCKIDIRHFLFGESIWKPGNRRHFKTGRARLCRAEKILVFESRLLTSMLDVERWTFAFSSSAFVLLRRRGNPPTFGCRRDFPSQLASLLWPIPRYRRRASRVSR